MKIGRFDKFTVDSVSKMAIRRVRTQIFIGRACWGMEVTLFDSPSPEDSRTGLGFIILSKLLEIRPVLCNLYNNQLLVREMRTEDAADGK